MYMCVCRFMDIGGWSMLNVWLTEAKKAQNTPLLTEILHVSVSTFSVCS